MVTRAQAMVNATAPPWELGTVEYSMEATPGHPTGADCSAYVLACWGVTGDYNTETMVSSGLMVEIPIDQLRQADAVGHCGPNTSGADGHVQLFDRWENDNPDDNHYWCYQQNGEGPGPRYDLVDWPIGYYKAYRYTGIEDDPAPAPEPPPPAPEPAPAPERRSVQVVPFTDVDPPWNSTLSGIAEQYGTTVEALAAINGISNPGLIYPDQVIYIDPA